MTVEQIKDKIATLERNQQQVLANYNAIGGAIQAYKEMLEELKLEKAEQKNENQND